MEKVLDDSKTLNKTLFNVLTPNKPSKTMKRIKNCKYCHQQFEQKRTNHVYCTASCKTKASYQRNNYKYVSGHYQKEDILPKVESLSLPVKNEVLESIKTLEAKIESIQKAPKMDVNSITNTAIGSATADAAVYAAKKLLAPNTLPATKGDIASLKNELNELKRMIQNNTTNKLPFY